VATGPFGRLITCFVGCPIACFVLQMVPGYFELRGLPRARISSTMTLGQLTEMVMLAAVRKMSWRLGARAMMAIGISAWFLSYLSLALEPPLWFAVAGTPMDGVRFTCVSVASQMHIDSRWNQFLRASAPSFRLVCASGLVAPLGGVMAGEIGARTRSGGVLRCS
jgi:hypothetical protein